MDHRKRSWLAAGLLASVLCGCAGEQEALIVSHAAVADATEDGCVFDPMGDALIGGSLDVSAGTGYFLAPVLVNNLSTRSGNSNSGVDDGELQLSSPVDVSLRLPSDVAGRMDPSLPLSFTVPIATDSLGPGDIYAAGFTAIPPEYATALVPAIDPGENVVAEVALVFHATRSGNSRGKVGVIDSREYTFPITLNNGGFVTSCSCDGDTCRAGTAVYALRCGFAQDSVGAPFSCDASSSGNDGGASGGESSSESSSSGPGGSGSSGSSGT